MSLTDGDVVRASEPPHHLCRRQFLLQESQGLVHAPRVLGRRSSVQSDV